MYWDVPTGVFVVADGMGGHQAGEVASRLAIDTIRTFLEAAAGDRDLTWPSGSIPAVVQRQSPGDRRELANRTRVPGRRGRADLRGDGHDDRRRDDRSRTSSTFCGVGDSRLYVLESESFDQLTHDDSLGRDRAGQGARRRRVHAGASPDAARAHRTSLARATRPTSRSASARCSPARSPALQRRAPRRRSTMTMMQNRARRRGCRRDRRAPDRGRARPQCERQRHRAAGAVRSDPAK